MINLTITDELARKLVVLLHQAQVERRSVTYFVISVIQTSCQEHVNAALDIGVLLTNTKFGQSSHSSSAHNCVLKDDTIVDVADVFCRLSSPGALHTQEVENADGKLGKLAVLDELAKVGKCLLLGFGNKLDQIKNALHDAALEVVSALVAQDTRKEGKHASLLRRKLEAKCANSLDNGNLELVCDVGHESADLLHEPVHARLIAGLEEGCDGECRNRSVGV